MNTATRRPAVLSRKKEGVHGDSDLRLSCRNVAAKVDECIKALKRLGRATRLDVRTMLRLARKTS